MIGIAWLGRLSISILLSLAWGSHVVERNELGFLRLDELRKGCGCMFSKAVEPDFYYLEIVVEKEFDGKPRMRLNGELTELEVVSSTKGPLTKEKQGDRFVDEYEQAGARVRLEAEVVASCPKLSPSCDRNKYSGTLRVNRGRSAETLNVTGHCGC